MSERGRTSGGYFGRASRGTRWSSLRVRSRCCVTDWRQLASTAAVLDAPTVLAAAVTAFHAEQRRRSSTSRAPDSVMAFAAPAGFR